VDVEGVSIAVVVVADIAVVVGTCMGANADGIPMDEWIGVAVKLKGD
jgi:hypothetical protein